jgi:hypothetical protein
MQTPTALKANNKILSRFSDQSYFAFQFNFPFYTFGKLMTSKLFLNYSYKGDLFFSFLIIHNKKIGVNLTGQYFTVVVVIICCAL